MHANTRGSVNVCQGHSVDVPPLCASCIGVGVAPMDARCHGTSYSWTMHLCSERVQPGSVAVGLRPQVFDAGGVTICLSPETKALVRSRWLTGGRGWTSSTLDHLHTAPSFCRAHGDVTHGGFGEFVSCPYLFPQSCMPFRLSVGARLFLNLVE